MTPSEARAYLKAAAIRPTLTHESVLRAAGELLHMAPAMVASIGSYLLSAYLAKKLGLAGMPTADPEEFITMIRQAQIAPVKVASSLKEATARGVRQAANPRLLEIIRKRLSARPRTG